MEIKLKDVIKDGVYAPNSSTFVGMDNKSVAYVFTIRNREPGVHKLIQRVKSIPGVNINAYKGLNATINVNSHNIEIVVYRDSDIKDVIDFIYRLSKLNIKLCEDDTFEYWIDFYNYSIVEHPYYVSIRFNIRQEPKEAVEGENNG